MKLLAEILGMTNYCNLRCTYCEWKMKPTKRLDDSSYAAAERNIRRIGDIVRERFPSIVIVEYSGGEPFVYPKIVEALLDTFPERWLRVSTNGSLIDGPMIARLSKSKAYMCLSLDGESFEVNKTRFGKNLKMFSKVNETVAALLSAGVPVMLLCTLNTTNVDAFPRFVEALSERYAAEIEAGLLTMPAHAVFEYERDNGVTSPEQALRFAEFIATTGRAYPIITNAYEHYERLADFLGVATYMRSMSLGRRDEIPPALRERCERRPFERTCFLHDWQVSFHFLDDAIAKPEGLFKSYGCGMRGVEDLGEHAIHSPEARAHLERVEDPSVNPLYRSSSPSLGERCPLLDQCFVDWNAIDMIFSGEVSLERAQRWNVLFRDPIIASAVSMAQAKYRPMLRAPGAPSMQRGALG